MLCLHRDYGSFMFNGPCKLHGSSVLGGQFSADDTMTSADEDPVIQADPVLFDPCQLNSYLINGLVPCPDVFMALQDVQFMAEHTRREQYTIRVKIHFFFISFLSLTS